MPLRLVFMGTPDFAVPTLPALIAAGHEIAAVYTRAAGPPAAAWPCGRRRCSALRRALGIPVFTPAIAAAPRRRPRFAALGARRRRGGRLRPDPAEGGPGGAPRSAASTCTPRCCRAGAARRRSSAPSWPAMPRPASWSCAWTRAWTPGRSLLAESVRIGAATPPATCTTAGARSARELMARALGGFERGTLPSTPQAAKRRRPTPRRSTRTRRASTGRKPAARSTPYPRPVALSRRLVRTVRRRGRIKVLLSSRARAARASPARCSTTR